MYKLTAEKLLKARSFPFLPTEFPIFVCLSACLLIFYFVFFLFTLLFFIVVLFFICPFFLIRLFTVPSFFCKIDKIECFALRATIWNECQIYTGVGGRPLRSFNTHPS